MEPRHIPFALPDIGEDEIAEVVDALRSGWITTGPRTRTFEASFAERVGAPSALGLSSCTAALHTSLSVLGVGPGDAVVTSALTFVSTVHVIEHVGARPILADIDPETLAIDPERVADAVHGARGDGLQVRALLPVHYAGHPCEMDPLEEIARAQDLAIIEDAAHALPAAYKGRPVGAPIDGVRSFACFSFYATKNLATGEGGMLTASTDDLERARTLSLHGMSRDAWQRYSAEGSWWYDVVAPGFKYNMTDIEAALGIVQLRRLDDLQRRRRAIWDRYSAAFAREDALEIPAEHPHVDHALHLYVLRLNLEMLTIDRDGFMDALRARGIGASVHFIPVHMHTYYRDRYGYAPEDLPVAFAQYQRLVSLPLHPGMDDADVDAVLETVLDIVRTSRR